MATGVHDYAALSHGCEAVSEDVLWHTGCCSTSESLNTPEASQHLNMTLTCYMWAELLMQLSSSPCLAVLIIRLMVFLKLWFA
jgi:hypothetical protein